MAFECPHCLLKYHPTDLRGDDVDRKPDAIVRLIWHNCPDCHEFIVHLAHHQLDSRIPFPTARVADGYISPSVLLKDLEGALLLYPKVKNPPILSQDIPKDYRDDYLEAHRTLEPSAKASAALSRRALQRLIETEANIKERDLATEIDKLLQTGLPAELAKNIDAIRNFGNFAAHPITSLQTGDVVDVESGEAEWTLDILGQLLDYFFVQPAENQRRRDALNQKLQAAGKKPMK